MSAADGYVAEPWARGSTTARTPEWRPSVLVLRVLTGIQKGAQATLRHHRLLVGNLVSECDVVLDVAHSQQHACLVRVSKDGWTVLAVAGDLWFGEAWVPPQQTRKLASGDVLTLGEVSFCIADAETDWAQVTVPTRRPAMVGSTRVASSTRGTPRDESGLAKVKRALRRLAKSRDSTNAPGALDSSMPAGTGTGRRWFIGTTIFVALALLVLGTCLPSFVVNTSRASASTASPGAATARAVLAEFPWAQELTLKPEPQGPRISINGYLAERAQGNILEQAMRRRGVEFDSRWTAVDELKADLLRRLALPLPASSDDVRYIGQGRFEVAGTIERFETVDHSIRRALQDVPALQSIELRLTDSAGGNVLDATHRTSVVVRYARADGAPGGIVAAGLEQLRPMRQHEHQHYGIRELRMGRLSSVVLDDGARYFEGSSLPGGTLLVQIQPSYLVVRSGDDTFRVSTSARSPIPFDRGGEPSISP